MRIDELYKFSDGTLNDVRNALDDRLKGIRMQYLPQTVWRKAWNSLLEDDCMRETSGCFKGPYDSSYAAPIFTEEIWLRVQQMMKGSDIRIQEKKAKNKHFPEKIASNLKFLNNLQPEWSRHVTIAHQTKDLHTADYTQLYDFLIYNQKETYLQQPIPNPKDITDPTTAMNMALALIAKAFKLNYSTPTNNNQRILSNPRNMQIAQPGMNMGQDRQMQMVGGNVGNQFRQYAGQNAGNSAGYNDVIGPQVIQNAVQNPRVQNVGNHNGLIGVQGNGSQNQIRNGNLVAARAEGNADGQNGNHIRCYNCMGVEEQYTELLEPIPESHQVPQNDNNFISKDTSVEQGGETVEQHPANFEETHALYELLYQNLEIEVEKVNSVNRKLKETNADLTTELARFKNQERCFEISQEKYDKLERCYQQSVYQEQCLSKKINALHLSSGKQIMTLNEQISESNKLSKEKSTVSFLLEENKRLKSDFQTCEDELLDKQIQLEKKDKGIDEQKMALGYQNPFYLKQAQKKQQSLYDGKVLLEKHDPPVVHDSEETLQLAQESCDKMKQMKKEIKPEAAKFVRDFKSLAKEADDSLAKHKALELEIKHLLKAVVSQDIMIFMQNDSVVDTSDLQTELDRTKERYENCIIKKETEYAKLWNDWYKKCDECKYDKISYDKAYKDMEQKIHRFQAQLGDLQGKSKDTSSVSDIQNLLSQKLENENVELEFQVLNYARENAHLKATYKNLFDSISLFKKDSDQKDNTLVMSGNTKLAKQPIVENLPKVGMFRINPFKTSMEEKHVPNTISASARTKPITVSQPHVITKKDVNSDLNGLSSTGVDNTKTRRP
nr:hypothetical protein [Tanacetum cinerariifolium]